MRNIQPGTRVEMQDRDGVTSSGLVLAVRGNPIDPNDPVRDAIVLLDDPTTKDPWGPADPTKEYWANSLPKFESIAGRKLTSSDRIAAPDIRETIPESIQHTVIFWISKII